MVGLVSLSTKSQAINGHFINITFDVYKIDLHDLRSTCCDFILVNFDVFHVFIGTHKPTWNHTSGSTSCW